MKEVDDSGVEVDAAVTNNFYSGDDDLIVLA